MYQGTVSREEESYEIPITASQGSLLRILVENQGRICFGDKMQEEKGIFNITLGPLTLGNWTHYRIPLEEASVINSLLSLETRPFAPRTRLPAFFKGTFALKSNEIDDTFLHVKGWSKGVAFLNGFNLGRYWPTVGPQITLYTPAHLFKPSPATNTLLLFETESHPCTMRSACTAEFVHWHIVNSTVPF